MSQERNFIEKLGKQKSSYTSPESAIDLANSLELLSTDIYTDNKRLIFELLQNADDASCGFDKLEVNFTFIDQYIIISHSGLPFTEIDIESICSIGDGNKNKDENKTGFKGIGFKSVFSHSDSVIINSGNYCFKFDKESWENYWERSWENKIDWEKERTRKGKEKQVKMPWQIIPVWYDLPVKFSFTKNYNVTTIIKYSDTQKLQKELLQLFSNTQILLFLRSSEVKINISGSNSLTIEKIKQGDVVKLKQNGAELSEWLVKSFNFNVDKETKKLIKNDIRIPKKLREVDKTEISFAVQIEKKKIKIVNEDNRLIFTYLPTSVNYNFSFLVNASFLTDAGRQHLHEDLQWNIWLFKQIPIKLFSWLAELAVSKYKNQILHLVPNTFSTNSQLKSSFNEGFSYAIKEIAFIPNKQGKLLKVDEAIYDKTNISEYLNPEILIKFINHTKNRDFPFESLITKIEPLSVLSRLGIEIFDIVNLKDFFTSKIFKKNHNLSENFSLILFLHEQSERYHNIEEKNNWNYQLRAIPFIFDKEKKLKSPREIYFPTVEFSEDFEDNICIINDDIICEIENNHRIKRWLEYLGVKEPSDISFIEKTIIGNNEYIIIENAISVCRYLFNTDKKGLLTEVHYNKLKIIKILTTKNKLISAQNAFLSDFYDPELKLEKVYGDDIFISQEYVSINDQKRDWAAFFVKIGVKESICWSKHTLPRTDLQYKYPIYFNSIPSGVPNHMYGYKNNFTQYEFNLISFIEKAVIYEFSKRFWSIVLSQNFIIKTGDIDNGICYYTSNIASLNDWIIKNAPIIPTTQNKCIVVSQVYSSNIPNIKEIAGKYLPVFDFDGTIPEEWLNYLPFIKMLVLDDYLTILVAIWQDIPIDENLQKENKNRVELIYEILASNYLGYVEKLSNWGKTNKLLAKDGKTFFNATDLSVVTVEGFKASNLALCDEKNENVIKLLRVFGVSIIDEVKPYIPNSRVEIQDLKRQLKHILPLIAVVSVEKSRSKKDWEAEYKRLKSKLTDIHFFETTEIYLSYGNEDDKQKRSSWAEGFFFYYVGNWYKPRVLDSLIEPLGKFLGILYTQRHLSILLSDSFQEGLAYLKEKFGEDSVDIIPDELLNPNEVGVLPHNYGIPPGEIGHGDLGHKGELYVFDELKKIYAKKYSKPIIETDIGFKVGQFVEVIWRNKIERTTFNHDFKVKENNSEIYIDSKATPYDESAEKIAFYVSPNEFALMKTADRYLIARVFNVTTTPSMKFIRLNIDKLN